MKTYYRIKNWLLNRKPHFSKEKFIKHQSRYVKRKTNKDHFDNLLVEVFTNQDAWFNVMDGQELVQLSGSEFRFKKKIKTLYPTIPIYWVEWNTAK
jgi:hypothetical protein